MAQQNNPQWTAGNKICDTDCVCRILIERNYGESPVCEKNYLLDLKYLGVANTELVQSVSFVTTLFILSQPGTKQITTKILGSILQIGRELQSSAKLCNCFDFGLIPFIQICGTDNKKMERGSCLAQAAPEICSSE